MGRKPRVTQDDKNVQSAIEYILKNYVYGELVTTAKLKELSGYYDREIIAPKELWADPVIASKYVEDGINQRGNDYKNFLSHVTTILLEQHKRCLRNNYAKGYNIIHPWEQARFAKDELANRVLCGQKKALRIIEYVATDKMSPLTFKAYKEKTEEIRKTAHTLSKEVGKLERRFADIETNEGKPATSPTIDKLRGPNEKRKTN